MSEPIKVGDLVIVVKHPHCGGNALGQIHSVSGLQYREVSKCKACGYIGSGNGAYLDVEYWAPLSWLQRIPPLSELESEDRKQEIEA